MDTKLRQIFEEEDIWKVIHRALEIAATDDPREFKTRRDGLAEKLYTLLLKSIVCHEVKNGRTDKGLSSPSSDGARDDRLARSNASIEVSDSKSKGRTTMVNEHLPGKSTDPDEWIAHQPEARLTSGQSKKRSTNTKVEMKKSKKRRVDSGFEIPIMARKFQKIEHV